MDAVIAEQHRLGLGDLVASIDLSLDHGRLDIETILAALAEALLAGEPSILSDHLRWGKVVLSHRGVGGGALKGILVALRAVLGARLPAQASAMLCDYIDLGRNALAEAPQHPPSFLDDAGPLRRLASEYLRAMLLGDQRGASALVFSAIQAGTPIQAIYSGVFEPVQREVGRLWQCNRISVAHEHYCSAATQLIMSQLYVRIIGECLNGHTVVVTCVNGELHEIGARMVSDFFDMAGWNSYYLGASTPTADVIRIVEERRAPVLCLSMTMYHHLPVAKELISKIRGSNELAGVRILAGGYPFSATPGLVAAVGADAGAPDARGAVEIANQWMQT